MNSMIYIVEDDKNTCEIESYALKNSGYSTESFLDAKSFFAAMEDKIPDLVLLDVMLPDEDGLEIVGKMRHNYRTNRVPIMLVTAKTTEIDKVKGLDIGADDYLTKPFGVMELISRVKALLRRSQSLMDEAVLTYGNIRLDADKRTVYADEEICELTYKEFELLKLLMKNHGIVISRDVIMERVWDSSFEGESRTIDVHVRTLRQKLGDGGALIKTIRNVGYMAEAK